MLPKNRPPTSPGEVLVEEFLGPLGMTQVELARRKNIPLQRVNTVVTGKRAITAETAVLLARVLGTSAAFWMNLQVAVDLWNAERKLAATAPRKVAPVRKTHGRSGHHSTPPTPRSQGARRKPIPALAQSGHRSTKSR